MAGTVDSHKFGIHYYQDRLGCLRRANNAGDEESDEARFGTMMHEWLRAYHCGLELPQLSEERLKSGCSPAQLAQRWASVYAPDIFGEVLLAEQTLDGTLTVVGEDYPIRGTVDLVTRMDVATVCAFQRVTGVLLEPGLYLHDYKTKGQHRDTTVPELINSRQATMYETLLDQHSANYDWAADFGTQFRGVLFHLLYRYKDFKDTTFRTIFVGRAYDEERRQLASLVRDASERERALGTGHCTPVRCYDWARLCPLFDECPRHNFGGGR